MPRIRVDPEQLHSVAQTIEDASTRLEDLHLHLRASWKRLVDNGWESRQRPRMETLWEQCQAQSKLLAERLREMGRQLDTHAISFQGADEIGADRLGQIARSSRPSLGQRSEVARAAFQALLGQVDWLGGSAHGYQVVTGSRQAGELLDRVDWLGGSPRGYWIEVGGGNTLHILDILLGMGGSREGSASWWPPLPHWGGLEGVGLPWRWNGNLINQGKTLGRLSTS